MSRLSSKSKKAFARSWNLNRNIVKTIDLWINQFFDEKTSFRIKFRNNFHFDSDFSINVYVILVVNHWNQYIIQRFCLDNFFNSQFIKTSLRITLSFWFLWLIKFIDYEMHEKRHRFSTNFEISIIQKSDERFKSKNMNKNHEKRKQFSFDQRNLNINQFFQRSTSISRQISLQNQKKRTRRDSALQNALNDSRIQTNRKIKLHENICLDD